jgi:hypothetical protein
MLKYDCILHYGKGCIMIRKGKRHMTVNSPALPRVQPPVEKENRTASHGFRTCLADERC